MRFEPSPPEIPDDDPFFNDALDLEGTGNQLKSLVKNAEGPAVIALNAPWGAGKTTFLKRWEKLMRLEGAEVVSYSAWESDYSGDALTSLLDELTDQIDAKEKLKRLKSAGISLVKALTPIGVRLATAGVLSGTELETAGVDGAVEKIAENKLQAHRSVRKAADKFRAALGAYAEAARQSQDLPLVIIIDELDRCRPSYAVETLEIVKHFFTVPNLVFVLGVDAQQLSHSIRGHYGNGYDAERYLRRFFHLELQLPEPGRHAFMRNVVQQLGVNQLFAGRSTDCRGRQYILTFIDALANMYQLSLRDLERALFEMSLCLKSQSERERFFPTVTAWLAVIRREDEDLFLAVTKHSLPAEEVWKRLEKQQRLAPLSNELEGEERFRAQLTYAIDGHAGLARLRKVAQTKLNEVPNGPEWDYWERLSRCAAVLEQSQQNIGGIESVAEFLNILK